MTNDPREELFEHAAFLERLAGRLCRDPQLAEDLAQTALLVAIRRRSRVDVLGRGWLGKVVRNLAANTRRDDTRRVAREEDVARPEAQPDHSDVLERLEARQALIACVMALPDAQRTAVYLRYYEGLTPRRIAEHLGVPVKTVKSQHTRALAALRARLAPRHEKDSRKGLLALLAPLPPPALGGLAMKTLVAVVLAVAGGLLYWSSRTSEPSGRTDGPVVAADPLVAGTSSHGAPKSPRAADVLTGGQRIAASSDVEEHTVAPVTGALDLHLRWSDGEAAGDIGVDVVCAQDPSPREERFSARTDARGLAVIEGLFAGRTSIEIDRGARFTAEVVAGETTAIELTIPEGAFVHGVVVDPDGVGIAHAEVFCEANQRLWPAATSVARTAADGAFRLRDVAVYAHIGARAIGYMPSVLAEAPARSDVEATPMRFVLAPAGGHVAGVVVDSNGAPVGGALVLGGCRPLEEWVDGPGGAGLAPGPVPVRTARDGTFELVGNLPVGEWPLFAVARGFSTTETTIAVREGAREFVRITLGSPARIEGTVRDGRADPVGGARVSVLRTDADGRRFEPFPPATVVSAADGTYRLDLVPAGARQVVATVEGSERLGRAVAAVRCVAGEVQRCDLVLDPRPLLAGRVVDGGGGALAGWRVIARTRDTRPFASVADTTSGDGSFLLANVAAGRHDVTVTAPGESPMLVRARVDAVEAGTADLVLVVEHHGAGKGTLRGLVRATSGELPAGVTLRARLAGSQANFPVAVDASSGQFEVELGAGAYELRLFDGATLLATAGPHVVESGRSVDAGVLTCDGRPK